MACRECDNFRTRNRLNCCLCLRHVSGVGEAMVGKGIFGAMATILAASLAAAGGAAAAEVDSPFADPKVWAQAAVFYTSVDTGIRVATTGGTGTDLDFETDLDFPDRRALPSGTLGLRLGRGWHLIADVYSLKRSRSATLDRNVIFDGVTYPAAGTVSGGFTSSVYRLTVNHDIASGDDYAVGLALGAHVTDFSVFLEGQGRVGQAQTSFAQRRREVLAPLPTVGVQARYRPLPRLQLSVRGDFLSLKISDYNGRLLNAQAGLDYAITDNVALGVMLRHVDYRLGVTKADWNGQIRYRFTGPAAAVTVMF